MKRMIYSNITKGIVAVLFIVSIALCALIVSDGIAKYCDERVMVYGFENDFSEVRFFSHMLDAPENAISNACFEFYQNDGETTAGQGSGVTAEEKTLEDRISERLNDMYCLEQINYYIEWNGKVFTNCGAENEKELMQAQFYSIAKRDDSGSLERERSQSRYYSHPMLEEVCKYDKTSNITVCTSIKDNYVDECSGIWSRQESIVKDTVYFAAVCIAFALLMLIYLICVCGKDKSGNLRKMWLDSIWAEVHLALMSGAIFGAVFICAILLDEYFSRHIPQDFWGIAVVLSATAASAIVLASLLSIIRNIKCKNFAESSIIFRILRWMWRTFIKVMKWIAGKVKSFKCVVGRALSEKTGIILITMLFVYTALLAICAICTLISPIWMFAGVLLFFFACFIIAWRAKDLYDVKLGVEQIRGGNLTYKIPEPKSEDMKKLAADVNDIAKGLDESVAAKLKAERLKTELITNISHDLKTPLTSIINYTALLEKEEGLSEEAKDYVRIIAAKSDRLKTLTCDLFDISKVQSGNEEVVFEKIDVALLINQSLGEHDSEIEKSGLPFCVNVDKELYISADGRKMSRVVSNLIENILKYTLNKTRVFITACEKDGEVVIEFKNIASYPMEFNAEEITGRFVRGDESRTAEGNGLGLAIAKSYTELCKGRFEIVIDGDMFKAIITFGRLQ